MIEASGRRSIYFAFQGLFMAVLVLLFLYQYSGIHDWALKLFFLVAVLGSSLVYLRLIPIERLSSWRTQVGLFLFDAALASLTLVWTQPRSEFYLIFFLIIFGTALTRDFRQSFVVALITCLLYLAVGYNPTRMAWPHDAGYWLRFQLLLVSTSLLAILARDSQQAQAEQERKYQERIIQIERLATLGQIAGEVAHRIKGPLTTIMVNAEVLSQRQGLSKDMLKELREIQEEVTRCKDILKNLLDLGRIEEMDFKDVDLRDPIHFALSALETQLNSCGMRVDVSRLETPLLVLGDQSLLQEAVGAVLQNAVDAGRKGGTLRLRVSEQNSRLAWPNPGPGRASYVVVIEDDGQGIAAKHLEKIFQPFFTTKGKEGSGLGLSAALRILQKHGGSIEAESGGRGARFTLTVPKKALAA